MLNFVPGPIRGAVSFSGYLINTLIWVPLLLIMALFKLIGPFEGWRRFCDRIINAIATNWISVNSFNMRVMGGIEWDICGLEGLEKKQWYLVISNHQSWVDILVLQKIFNRRIPFLKFFLKKELIWVPVMGLAWWALDYPFMKRYSKSFLKKNPHLKGKDVEITKKACDKFKRIPVSVMNFVEGTRLTAAKQRRQQSPYRHLLKPKSGGIAMTLAIMGEQFHRLLDVTIVYPEGVETFWGMLCGRLSKVRVQVNALPVAAEFIGDYFEDPVFRANFQQHLNALWEEKDRRIGALLAESGEPAGEAAEEGDMVLAAD
ncbi:MAG: acyltransferase [Desulfobacterales bacterium]|nr:acyltransferase [Desulfobacterales bacterium]